MDLQRLQQMLSGMSGRGGAQPDAPAPDTAEKIQISSLSLLKMLKHGKKLIDTIFDSSILLTHLSSLLGRAGVPMEVMGLMLGQFIDDYTITCVDVFAMPQVSFN